MRFLLGSVLLANSALGCTTFTVVVKDPLGNLKQGLPADDVKWFQNGLGKKYPNLCYIEPSSSANLFFWIEVTSAVHHGTRVITDSSTNTEGAATTSHTAVPYEKDYGVFTMTVERKSADGNFLALHRFQQKGLYATWYGIPLGGRGHHPVHALLEDAAKWIAKGGLTDPLQGVVSP
ncbi:MAG: hypothetical protein ABSG13_07475 [Bryobacteraceae bacterium]|jgi:hypothetical protein